MGGELFRSSVAGQEMKWDGNLRSSVTQWDETGSRDGMRMGLMSGVHAGSLSCIFEHDDSTYSGEAVHNYPAEESAAAEAGLLEGEWAPSLLQKKSQK